MIGLELRLQYLHGDTKPHPLLPHGGWRSGKTELPLCISVRSSQLSFSAVTVATTATAPDSPVPIRQQMAGWDQRPYTQSQVSSHAQTHRSQPVLTNPSTKVASDWGYRRTSPY